MSRIAPLEPPYAPEIQSSSTASCAARRRWCCFASSRATRGPGRNSAPAACWTADRCRLREREIVIDRTCALTGCEYEWGVHVATFAEAGASDRRAGPRHGARKADAPCWSPAEQALIAAVDALHHRATLSGDGIRALSAHYDDAKIFEIILLCGFYRTVSYLANGLDLPLEETAARFPTSRSVGKARCDRTRRMRVAAMRCDAALRRRAGSRVTPRRPAACRADARCRPAFCLRSRSAR